MEIKFKKITIKNFKGITELSLEFNNNKNIIEGENGIGKTTVLDAITWCLFGKNFADEKQFKIKPILDGEEKKDLVTSVELEINDRVVERIWDKDITVIKVDGVKFGNREFTDYLRDNFLITDEEFKALSNIDYIPKLHWKDLRSLIMSLVGEITNEEVYLKCDVSLIKDKIESVGVDKTAENITDSKSQLNNDIKVLSGNIDQKTNDINTLTVDDEEFKEYEKKREQIKSQIDSLNLLNQEKNIQDNEITKLNNSKNDLLKLEQEITKLSNENEEYQKTYDNSNIDISAIKEQKIKMVQYKIDDRKKDIERLELEIGTLRADREDLKNKYEQEVNKDIKVENSTCSSCGQALPQEKIQEVLTKLKDESISLANGYAAKAKIKKTEIEEKEQSIHNYNLEIKAFEEEIEQIKNEQISSGDESDIQKIMKQNISKNNLNIEKYREEIINQISSIKELEERVKNHKNIEINDVSELQNQLEEIMKKLAISDTLKIFKDQLKDLENKYQDKMISKELLNQKEQQLIAFNNTKATILKEKVSHNFKLVDFITQETTKDGKLVETFKIALNGVEYSSINTGHRILLALDLIDNIQKLKNKRIPILIDGLGELTRLPELETQVIGCRAKYQLNKKMELVGE